MLKQILIIKLIQHKNARHVLKGVAVHHAQQTAEHAVAQKTVTESGHHARAADACHTGGNAAIHIRLNGIMENIIRPFLAIDAIKVSTIHQVGQWIARAAVEPDRNVAHALRNVHLHDTFVVLRGHQNDLITLLDKVSNHTAAEIDQTPQHIITK